MPNYICKRIKNFLVKRIKIKKKCLIVGVAYKKNVDDMGESPSLKIIEILEKIKFIVIFMIHILKL